MLKYAFFDGDNIGNTIDNLLTNGRVREATHLSESIKSAIFQIELFVKSTEDAEIIISGGDDVLVKYNSEKYGYDFLQVISQIFISHTGLSMSCGAGDNVIQAINNLESVKQQRKGEIRFSNDMSEIQRRNIKQTRLYIFTSSDVPDPSINVIAHCLANYGGLDQITLIGITVDRGKEDREKEKLDALKQNIDNQLKNLISGKYMKKKGKLWEEKEIEIASIDCEKYKTIKSFIDRCLNIKVLIYQDLERQVLELSNTEDSVQNIFDMTTVLKSYLVDIYTILRFGNVSTIYSFELYAEERSYDEKELIHNLTHQKTYDYLCLAESFHTRDRVVVSETSTIQAMQMSYTYLEDMLAVSFARFWSLIYVLVWLPILLWIIHSVAQPDGWNRVEPLAFLTTFCWYLLNCLLQGIFTGKFPSLDPRELFHALKAWKKQRLERFRLNSRRS